MDILIIILLVLIFAALLLVVWKFEEIKEWAKQTAFSFDDWIVTDILVPIRKFFGLPTTAPQYWGPKTKEEADKLTHKTSKTGEKKPEDFVFESSPDFVGPRLPSNQNDLTPEEQRRIKDWLSRPEKKRPTNIKGSFQ